jgi:hypothetical protein
VYSKKQILNSTFRIPKVEKKDYNLPTIFKKGPYRFFFYSGDNNEPAHIHVERDNKIAKFWIKPVTLAYNAGFKQHEIVKLRNIIQDNQNLILEAWNEFFQF